MNPKDPQEVKNALGRAENLVKGKGFMGWLTRLFLGKKSAQQFEGMIDEAKKYAVDEGPRRARLMQVGLAGQAQVLKIEDTGKLVNYNPVVVLSLRVSPAAGAPFEIAAETMVSKIAIPRVGDTLSIKYDAANNQDFIIV